MPRAEIIDLEAYRRTKPMRRVKREPEATFRLIQLFRAPPPGHRAAMRKLAHRLAERRRDRI
jgi:hypothetical protein